jgi:hypothetical protein
MKRITTGKLAILSTLCAVILLYCSTGNAWVRPGVSTDRPVYYPGETVRVHYSGAPGYNRDWICIVHAGAPDTSPGNYQYLPWGVHRGTLFFTAPRPGHYEVRAYYNYRANGYLVSARNSFVVETQAYSRPPRAQEEYVESSPQWHDSSAADPTLKQVQYYLMERGYDCGDADGLYGKKTRAAIRDFQRDNKLKQSGKLNMVTLKAMGLLNGAASPAAPSTNVQSSPPSTNAPASPPASSNAQAPAPPASTNTPAPPPPSSPNVQPQTPAPGAQ